MKVLGIETSSNIGGVAICDGDAVIADRTFEKGMHHEKELIPAIKALFDKNSLKPKDIDLISISVGPGSYTGLRVGIACAKTLSYALRKPVVDVPSMDVIVQNVKTKHKCICPLIDAKREMVYMAIYENSPDGQFNFSCSCGNQDLSLQQANDKITSINFWKKRSGLSIISPGEVIGTLPEGTFVFGDGVSRYSKLFEDKKILIGNSDIGIPKASIVSVLGMHAYNKGKQCDINTLEPIYLRKPEALEKKCDGK